jgi:hypothetical protein
MRVTLSSITAARSVRTVLESYGYSATQVGRDVVTDCPTLLAVPAIERQVGLAAIDRLDLTRRADAAQPSAVGRQHDGLGPAPLPALCSRGAGHLYA